MLTAGAWPDRSARALGDRGSFEVDCATLNWPAFKALSWVRQASSDSRGIVKATTYPEYQPLVEGTDGEPNEMTTTATTVDGAAISLGDEQITKLRGALRGALMRNDHAGYENARHVWNGNIDRRPALIARCTGVVDVQQSVNFARTHGLRLSVRDGGHSAPGYGTNDGGLVIDMSAMKGIRVDPAARTARVEGGVIWRELDHETHCCSAPPRSSAHR